MVAQTHVVKPRGYDVNENSLSDVCRTELGLTEEQIKTGQPIEQVIEQVSDFFMPFCFFSALLYKSSFVNVYKLKLSVT